MGTSQTETAVYYDKICIIYMNEKTWNFWCGVLRMHSCSAHQIKNFFIKTSLKMEVDKNTLTTPYNNYDSGSHQRASSNLAVDFKTNICNKNHKNSNRNY